MLDQYELTIETQERFTNEDGETKYGPVRKAYMNIEAKSETEAAFIARTHRTDFNNVTVNRI